MFRNVLLKSVEFHGKLRLCFVPSILESWTKNISTVIGIDRVTEFNRHSDHRSNDYDGRHWQRRQRRKNREEDQSHRRQQERQLPPNLTSKILQLFSSGGVSLGILGFFEKKEETSMEEVIVLHLKKAILSIQRGELDTAEEHLVNALRLSHEYKMEDVKTQIIDMQANLALQKQDYDRADMLFKITAQRLVHQQHYETNHNAIIEISLKLAQIYANRGQKEEAVTGYQYCIDAQRLKIEEGGEGDEDTLLLAAWAMHSLAQLQLTLTDGANNYIDKAQIEKTAILIKDAYIYAARAVGPDSEQAISIQSDLASTLALTGDFEGALTKLKEIENIAREKHLELYPHIKVNIGNVYLQKGSYLEAERVCVDARIFAKNVKNMEAFARAEECLMASTKARESS